MFKKLFDKKNGETRTCRICAIEFHTMKPINVCPKCACAKQKNVRIKKIEEGKLILKAPYPYTRISKSNKKEYAPRFKKLQSCLNKIKIRSEWQQYFKEKLDEILADEVLMLWINDRRDPISMKKNVTKKRSTINKDFPDTRGYYEY